jgi:hypothetical protein
MAGAEDLARGAAYAIEIHARLTIFACLLGPHLVVPLLLKIRRHGCCSVFLRLSLKIGFTRV